MLVLHQSVTVGACVTLCLCNLAGFLGKSKEWVAAVFKVFPGYFLEAFYDGLLKYKNEISGMAV